jgi:hypothetical protein
MAYKQKGCTPVTAKVQKTTKGGMVQQPLLNMGAPVKMKAASPTKLTPSEVRAQSNKSRVAANKAKEAAELKSKLNKGPRKSIRGQVRAEEVKNNPNRTKGFNEASSGSPKNNTKKDIAIEKVAGGYFGNTLGKDKPKDSSRIDFPIEPKKDNKKETGNVIKRKKVEAIKPNVEAKTVSMETKSEIVLPKKVAEVKNIEKAGKKIDIAENKETRAAKVRAKGEKALAEGNKDKALRLKRREERILKRAQKKRSQASEAIEPN